RQQHDPEPPQPGRPWPADAADALGEPQHRLAEHERDEQIERVGAERPGDQAQSQRLCRKKATRPRIVTIISATIAQNASALPKPGKWTFIPKIPEISVSGSRMTLNTVSRRRTSF